MREGEAKPGPRDGSTPLMIMLIGVVIGLALFLLTGADGPYGVFPYLFGGAVVGGLAGLVWRRP